MKPHYLITIPTLIALTLAGCGDKAPPAVSFSKQIQPLLNNNCIECHKPGGQGFVASGLSMQSYDSLMKGTKFGPVIKPGDSLSSTLIRLIKGLGDPSINMPHGDRKPLSPEEIALIETWVNQGAKNN